VWLARAVGESGLPEDIDPKKKLDGLMHLAEMCIEVLQQNEEYHAEVGAWVHSNKSII